MRRKALLIGNFKYSDKSIRRLFAPKKDVRALKSILTDSKLIHDYFVSNHYNLPLKDMNHKITSFFENSKSNDILLFYFSGHGERDNKTLYLYPTDTKKANLPNTAFNINLIINLVRKSKAKIKILFIDCCKGGTLPLDFNILPKGECDDSGIAVITASRSGELAYEKEYSYFTKYLIQGMTTKAADLNNDNKITIEELWEYIRLEFEHNSIPQKPVKNIYTACEIPIIEYKSNKVIKPKDTSIDNDSEIITFKVKSWSELKNEEEYSFLVCLIHVLFNKKIESKEDIWKRYILNYLEEKDQQETEWRPWISKDFTDEKIYRCPIESQKSAEHRTGKLVKIFLNKKYNDFLFNYRAHDINFKIVLIMRNLTYNEKAHQIDININKLFHATENLETNKLYFLSNGIDFMPEKIKQNFDFVKYTSQKQDLYSLDIQNSKTR